MLIRRMPFAKRRCIIEHGHLADEATVRLIAQGAWLSTQPGSQATEKPAPGQEEKESH